MTTDEKNQISHRGKAVKKLIAELPAWFAQKRSLNKLIPLFNLRKRPWFKDPQLLGSVIKTEMMLPLQDTID